MISSSVSRQFCSVTISMLMVMIGLCASQDSQIACRDKQRLLGTDFEDKHELTEATLGSTHQLTCHYCNEADDLAPKLWYFEKRLIFDDVPQEVKLGMSQNASENHYRLDLSNGLIIQNVTPDDAGIYFCHGPYEDEYNKYNYLLDVVIKPKNTVIGQSDEDLEHFVSTYLSSPNTNFSSSPLPDFDRLRSIFGVQLTALTAWDHWTPCDPCDNVRRRQARCILKPAVIETVLARLNLTEETERAVYLATFELSCYSIEMREHFPQVFDMLQQIPEFYQVESCFPYGECDPNAGEAKRREPYYRNHYLLPEGSDLFLICPESSTETHIVWRKDGKVIDPTRSAPGGHIIINSFSTLFLVDGSGFETSGNYTCYVDGIRMQETIVRFISGDSIKQAIYRRHMSYLLYIFLLCAIFYIGGLIRAFTRRHTFRQINWDDKQAEDKPRLLEVVEEE